MTTASSSPDPAARLTRGWRTHSAAWTEAVRTSRIASRVAVTDAALITAILELRPARVLDLGCGEGWLARRLAPQGIAVTGIDAAPELIAAAQAAGGGDFRVADYGELPSDLGRFDLAVSNFALLGREPVERLLTALPEFLEPGAALVIQTLHPLTLGDDQPYRDGWREDSWAAFSTGVEEPPPWYFRTLGSWIELLGARGFGLRELREPREPRAGDAAKPASLLLVAQRTAGATGA
jgi:2-polyprenyl-3-methyl-5-hydroxy-6-metoxy-1,4-benzoquinol methylase